MRRSTARETFAFAAFAFAALLMTGYVRASSDTGTSRRPGLWREYEYALASAKYIDLTHTISPAIPVWKGFARSSFGEAVKPGTGKPYSYQADGFVATQYRLGADQLGTQLDPPAHWDPHRPAIDELPPTFAVRPLVVISIVDKVRKNFNYALQVGDIRS